MAFDDEELRDFLHQLLQVISRAFWHPASVRATILNALPPRSRRANWPETLTNQLFRLFEEHTAPPASQISQFLQTDRELQSVLAKLSRLPRFNLQSLDNQFRPHPTLRTLQLPDVSSRTELARLLRISPLRLAAFYNGQRPPVAVDSKQEHYHYRWLPKRYGNHRLIEIPKERLKEVQTLIRKLILDHIPAHPAASAFVKGLSIRDAVAMHVGQDVLFRIDLKDFFPSIGIGKVRRLFRFVGYPIDVADCLAALCTNVAPMSILTLLPEQQYAGPERLAKLYQLPHLPQGAPTSPALSNLVSYRLDARLTGLARCFGAKYSRYADDLMFSGDRRLAKSLGLFESMVLSILIDEGFLIRRRKRRVMRRGRRQTSLGLTLNAKVNTNRNDYQALKAMLFNCVRWGPTTQNGGDVPRFREHIAGRIAFHAAINPRRGQMLRAMFDQIDWPANADERVG